MDASHFDAVASKHGDPHTRFMDNAVDDADDEAEEAMAYELGRRVRDEAVGDATMPQHPGGERQVGPAPTGLGG